VILIIKLSGHRGYKDKEIENTKAAFLRAIEEKLDYVELDLRKTSDEEIIVFHDRKINRLLNGRGATYNYSLRQLKEFKYNDDQSILTFKELLDITKGKVNLILDVKTKGIEEKIIDLLKEYGIEKEVIIQSFSSTIITRFQKIDPDLNYAIFRTFMGKQLVPHGFFARVFYKRFVKRNNVKYLNIDGPFLYDELMTILKEEGIKIILGALKVEKYVDLARKWDFDIINSNNPAKIKELLN